MILLCEFLARESQLNHFQCESKPQNQKFSHFPEEHRDVTRICLPNGEKSYIIVNGIQKIIVKGRPFTSVGTYGRNPTDKFILLIP